MKVSESMQINSYNITQRRVDSSKLSFGQEQPEIRTGIRGDKYLRVDIFDKIYNFKLENDSVNSEELNKMIKNIEGTQTGFFIRFNTHEHFIPYILKKIPKMRKDMDTIEKGNAVTEVNEETENALKVFESLVKRKIDIMELKTIKYLRRYLPGYANNEVKTAFSYFDKLADDLYLFFPQNNRIKLLTHRGLTKSFKV